MKKIVNIQQQKRNRKRYTLYFDDGEWIGLFDELIIKHGLRTGREVDTNELAQLAREDDEKKALEMGIRYLGYRSRSQKEMETYLESKGFCQEVIEATICKLQSYGYIDDLAFAKNWVKDRMVTKPMGRSMIKRELIYKGIDEEIIEESLNHINHEEEEERAYALALKYSRRYRDLEPREQLYKLGQALARRGFSWEVIRVATRRLNLEEYDD